MWQGTPAEIKSFVYGASTNPRGLQLAGGLKGKSNFTLLAKSSIVGNQTHPIFKLAKVATPRPRLPAASRRPLQIHPDHTRTPLRHGHGHAHARAPVSKPTPCLGP